MAIDQMYVVNQALAHLGQEQTATIDPDEPACSAATRKILAHADAARDAVLERHPWGDALVYESLTAAAVEGTGGVAANWRWPYHFLLGADALRVFLVGDPACAEPEWERGVVKDLQNTERKCIRSTDAGPIDVAYTRRIAWTSMSQALCDCIGLELAARACHPVTGNAELALSLAKRAAMAFDLAQGSDGVQQGGQAPLIPSTFADLRAGAY